MISSVKLPVSLSRVRLVSFALPQVFYKSHSTYFVIHFPVGLELFSSLGLLSRM